MNFYHKKFLIEKLDDGIDREDKGPKKQVPVAPPTGTEGGPMGPPSPTTQPQRSQSGQNNYSPEQNKYFEQRQQYYRNLNAKRRKEAEEGLIRLAQASPGSAYGRAQLEINRKRLEAIAAGEKDWDEDKIARSSNLDVSRNQAFWSEEQKQAKAQKDAEVQADLIAKGEAIKAEAEKKRSEGWLGYGENEGDKRISGAYWVTQNDFNRAFGRNYNPMNERDRQDFFTLVNSSAPRRYTEGPAAGQVIASRQRPSESDIPTFQNVEGVRVPETYFGRLDRVVDSSYEGTTKMDVVPVYSKEEQRIAKQRNIPGWSAEDQRKEESNLRRIKAEQEVKDKEAQKDKAIRRQAQVDVVLDPIRKLTRPWLYSRENQTTKKDSTLIQPLKDRVSRAGAIPKGVGETAKLNVDSTPESIDFLPSDLPPDLFDWIESGGGRVNVNSSLPGIVSQFIQRTSKPKK